MRANVNVVLTDDANFVQAKISLESKGLTVRAQVPEFGALTGTVEEELLPELRAVDGVLAIETEETVTASEASFETHSERVEDADA